MRWTLLYTVALIALAPAMALAGTPEDPEITDPSGDAGVEGTALPAGGEDVDILAAWFTTNRTGTWAHLELVSFDVHPEDVVFTVDATLSEERWLGVGYGSYVLPFPPFRTQGFQGCTGTDGEQPNCTKLPGRMLDERPGFAVQIPPSWIEGETRLREPTARVAAYAMFPAVTFDEAGPGEAYPLEASRANLTPASSDAPDTETGHRDAPGAGLYTLLAVLAGALALAGRGSDRRGDQQNGLLMQDEGGP